MAVKDRNEVGLLLRELSLQQLAEKMVIAVPLPPVVERDEEEVRAFDLLELVRRALVPQHRVAERPAHSVEHGGPAQEAQGAGPQARQVLRVEVVRQVAVVAAEARPPTARLLPVADRQCCQVESRRPALTLLDQLVHPRLAERDAGGTQEQLRLPLAQRQLLGAELEKPSARPQRS